MLLLPFATPAEAAAFPLMTMSVAHSVCFFFMNLTLSAALLIVTSSGSCSAYWPGTVRLMLLLVQASWMSDAEARPATTNSRQQRRRRRQQNLLVTRTFAKAAAAAAAAHKYQTVL
jgi:hypothetical protein